MVTALVMVVCAVFSGLAGFVWGARWPDHATYKVDRFGLNGARIQAVVGTVFAVVAVVVVDSSIGVLYRLILAALLPALVGVLLRRRWERQDRAGGRAART